MEREEEWEKEEEEGSLVRTRKGKNVNIQDGVDPLADKSRSVYLDEEEGIWKCHHCSWTYRMGSHGIDHVHSHEEYVRGVDNAKTLSQLGSCFFSQNKGSELTEENAGTIFRTVGWPDGENNHENGEADLEIKKLDILNGLSNVDNDRSQIDMRVKSQIHSNITSLGKTNFTSVIESADKNVTVKAKTNGLQSCKNDEVDSTEKNFEAVEITYINDSKIPMNMKTESQLDSNFIHSKGYGENGASALKPIKEVINTSLHGTLMHSSKAIVEMDVERVLEEQDTHDLYCPNCKSCITKRVILRKRKRIIQDVQLDTKRERIEPLLQPVVGDSPAETDEPRHDTGPDVFRCLSCFSIFIPSEDGFKSLWIFRRNNEGEHFQSPPQTPARNLSWIPAIFERFRVKNTRNEPVGEAAERVQEGNVQTSGQFQNPSETQTGIKIDHVFLDQVVLMLGKSNANAAESVGSEIRNPFQEKSRAFRTWGNPNC